MAILPEPLPHYPTLLVSEAEIAYSLALICCDKSQMVVAAGISTFDGLLV